MKLLKEYLKAEKKIHNYFGYEKGDAEIQIEESTIDTYWYLNNNNEVLFADSKSDMYDGDFYYNKFSEIKELDDRVYYGKEYTMIVALCSHCGNPDNVSKLCIFDNSKRMTDCEMKYGWEQEEWCV